MAKAAAHVDDVEPCLGLHDPKFTGSVAMAFTHDRAAKRASFRIAVVIAIVQEITVVVAKMHLDDAVFGIARKGLCNAIDIW